MTARALPLVDEVTRVVIDARVRVRDFDAIGDLISMMGSDSFPQALHDYCRARTGSVCLTGIIFPKKGTPKRAFATVSSQDVAAEMTGFISRYIGGEYLLDEYLRQYARIRSNRSFLIDRSSVPNDRADYYYFDCFHVTHVVAAFGRVGDDICNLCFSFDWSTSYRGQEALEVITSELPILNRIMHRHQQLVAWQHTVKALDPKTWADLAEQGKLVDAIVDVFRSSKALSLREAQVCAASILGHSTDAVALKYGISPHTVATYRQRAFAKLGIRFSGELFGPLWSALMQHPLPEALQTPDRGAVYVAD